MKKIPTLYVRQFEGHKIVGITNEVTPGCERIANGEGIATVKYDGACCAIINGEFYKRYDAKRGKKIPEGAIKCQDEADPITGHFPCWVKVNPDDPGDKWFVSAYDNTEYTTVDYLTDGTYEAVGKHFQDNPYNCDDVLIRHGEDVVKVGRSLEELREFLTDNYIEGLVFWLDGEPICKIKRSDFGLKWGN